MAQIKLLLVGGFLGAGKTTLLGQAAALLVGQGKRVGLITNDQAAQLVDTGLLQQAGLDVQEISGGCFCCRFADLVSASERLVDTLHPDVLIGEPVGSCTDLSATVLQPLKDLYADRFAVAPFSVLVDPYRLWEVVEPRRRSPLHASARYILRKQLEEADAIVLNKVDLLPAEELAELRQLVAETFGGTPLYCISAATGQGVAEWLTAMLRGDMAGRRIVEVDYDTYAEGEAVLGWLNATVRLAARQDTDWAGLADDLMARLHRAFQERNAEVGHVKLLVTADGARAVTNLTRLSGVPSLRNNLRGPTEAAQLIINARVEMPPQELQAIVERCLRESVGEGISADITALESLSPGRPNPTHRYAAVV